MSEESVVSIVGTFLIGAFVLWKLGGLFSGPIVNLNLYAAVFALCAVTVAGAAIVGGLTTVSKMFGGSQ